MGLITILDSKEHSFILQQIQLVKMLFVRVIKRVNLYVRR